MYPVKQSTALPIPVFAHDENGDAVTGLVDGGFTKRISKNGGAFGAMTVTITEMENGFYSLPLGTGHTDTTGVLTVILTHASAKQINIQVRVFGKLIDDLNDLAATDIVSAGAITTLTGAVVNVDTVDTLTTYTGNTLQTADVGARVPNVLNTTALGNIGVDWANVENPTSANDLSATDIQLVDTVTTYTGNTPQTGDSYARLGAPAGASVSADILAIDNFVDGLETTIGTPAGASVSADIAAVQADTDDIQTRLPAALVSGKMDADAVAVGGSTDGANRLAKATQCNVFCTVGSASTTTSIVTSAMDPAAAATDQFKGKIVTFDANTTTANLRGQSTDITASTAGGVLTVTAMTDAPVSGDTFVIT